MAAFAFLAFIGAACAVGYYLIRYSGDARHWILGANGKIDVAAVLVVSPLVLIILWLFRMITRLFNVGVTESTDASQRQTMVTTYLALVNDRNSMLTGSERLLILQALFRANGAHDEPDPLPANMVEAFAKLAQGKV